MQIFWRINVVKCPTCGLGYKEHVPNERMTNFIYKSDYAHFSFEGREKQIRDSIPRVKRMGSPNGRHLDYGCGAGNLVNCALNYGWDSYGADPFLPNLDYKNLSNRLFKVDISKPESYKTLGKFDCITLWAVFEHINSLGETLEVLISMLNDGGRLIMNSPNAESIIAKNYGPTWKLATLLEHFHFATTQCFQWIGRKHNLTILKIKYCGSPFPFGRGPTDLEGQGLQDLPLQCPSFECKNNDIDLNKKINGKISPILAYCNKIFFSDGGESFFANIIRIFINISKIGDHLEVTYVKK